MTVYNCKIWIPENDLGVLSGYYDNNGVVTLLRMYCDKPEVVYFIADMMEE